MKLSREFHIILKRGSRNVYENITKLLGEFHAISGKTSRNFYENFNQLLRYFHSMFFIEVLRFHSIFRKFTTILKRILHTYFKRISRKV